MELNPRVFRCVDVYLFGAVTERFTRDRTISVFDSTLMLVVSGLVRKLANNSSTQRYRPCLLA